MLLMSCVSKNCAPLFRGDEITYVEQLTCYFSQSKSLLTTHPITSCTYYLDPSKE